MTQRHTWPLNFIFHLSSYSLMCHAFERLRVIREYRSPRTIRSFTKVFIFLMPILLSPYYVHMGIKSGNTWSPYYIAVLTSFIFGTLQGVQDVLDDPFDGISADDINLGQVRSVFKRIQWTLSKSGFPPSRNFYMRTHVNFTHVNNNRDNVWKVSRKRKSWTSLNF